MKVFTVLFVMIFVEKGNPQMDIQGNDIDTFQESPSEYKNDTKEKNVDIEIIQMNENFYRELSKKEDIIQELKENIKNLQENQKQEDSQKFQEFPDSQEFESVKDFPKAKKTDKDFTELGENEKDFEIVIISTQKPTIVSSRQMESEENFREEKEQVEKTKLENERAKKPEGRNQTDEKHDKEIQRGNKTEEENKKEEKQNENQKEEKPEEEKKTKKYNREKETLGIFPFGETIDFFMRFVGNIFSDVFGKK